MTAPVFRIVGAESDEYAPRWRPQVQLSLFGSTAERVLLCLPMLDLHGETFIRLITSHRPVAVLDLRSHPYFERPSLDRSIAFNLFGRSCGPYLHKAFDLRPPQDQKALWRMRTEAVELFLTDMVDLSTSGGATVAVLVNHRYEIEVLEQAVRLLGEDGSTRWTVSDPTRR